MPFLRATPYRWHRQVNGRSEKHIDERRLTVDAQPDSDDLLILNGGVRLADLRLQVQIFDLEPAAIAAQVERPSGSIGWLEHIEEYDCVSGWFCVGPTNFQEIWQMPIQTPDSWTLQLWVDPLDPGKHDSWNWDTKKTPFIWIERASFTSVTDVAKKITR